MHPKDLAYIWERWSHGASLYDLATELGVRASVLHRDLQAYLAAREDARRVKAGAA